MDKNTKIIYRREARNTGRYGERVVEVGRVFNLDGIIRPLTKEEIVWLNTIGKEFKQVPKSLADPTNYKNFREFVKLA